jgi:hypothetical protein
VIVKIQRRVMPFALVNKAILEDTRLSWKAKGMMAYFLSRPETWTVMSEDVTKRSTDGRDSVLAGMNELRQFGYARLETSRDEKGRVTSGKFWVIREEPILLSRSEGNGLHPETGFSGHWETQLPDNPEVGKPATSNKEEDSKKEYTKNEPPNPPKGGGRKKAVERVSISDPLALKVGAIFGRRPDTLWQQHEWDAFQKVNPSQEEVNDIVEYYDSKPEFPKQTLCTLLNNWAGELDKIYALPAPKVRYSPNL